MRLLLERGADIKAKDLCGNTPLYGAAENGHEVVMWLPVKGADIKASMVGGKRECGCCWNATRTSTQRIGVERQRCTWQRGTGHEVVGRLVEASRKS